MINKECILKDIYNYYPVVSCEPEKCIIEKNNLRNKKIRDKYNSNHMEVFRCIENLFQNNAVIDWTDSESCCFEYKILLHKNTKILDDDKMLMKSLNGKRYDMRIFISILGPYYYEFVEETQYLESKNKWVFSTVKEYDKNMVRASEIINKYLSEKEYIKLSDYEIKIIVPGIETELKSINCASVFDCLFTDLVTIF